TTGSRRQPHPYDMGGSGAWGAGAYGAGTVPGGAASSAPWASAPPAANWQAGPTPQADPGMREGATPQGPHSDPLASPDAHSPHDAPAWQAASASRDASGRQEWDGAGSWSPGTAVPPSSAASAVGGPGWASGTSGPTQPTQNYGRSYSAGAAAPPLAPMTPPTWAAPAPTPAPRRLRAGTNLAVLGIIVLLAAASLYFTFIARVSEGHELEPIAIGCGAGLIVVGLVMAWAALRDHGAGWMVALSVVGVMIALPLAAILPWSHSPHAATGPDPVVQIDTTTKYDWTADTVSGIGDIDLDLTGAPTDVDKTVTIDGSIGGLVVHVRQGQSLAFHIDGSTGTLSGEYYTDADGNSTTDPWVPQVDYVANALSFKSEGWNPAAGITVMISGSIGDITIIEDAPAKTVPEDTQSQSGSAQSGGDSSPAPTTPAPSRSGSPSGEPSN
ncbi:MAG: hypothetical protein L0L69_11115, partial [Propionibacterium sp.]|nr:hypothetical protein [Propionibacterium sp.]